MGSYYYLGAQLPYLIYGERVPISSAAFKDLALEHMNTADAALLDSCSLSPYDETGHVLSTSSKVINSWNEWEASLRLNLAKGRSGKLKQSGEAYAVVPELPTDAVAAAKAALALESPLEAELYLDRARWKAIESFQGLDTFSENAMYAYLLKLLLLERRAAFDVEEGFKEYKELYTAIQERAEGATWAEFASEMTEPGEPK